MLAIRSLVLLPFLNLAIPFSRGSFQPRDWTQISRIAGGFFTNWTIREALKILMLSQKSQIQKKVYKVWFYLGKILENAKYGLVTQTTSVVGDISSCLQWFAQGQV